MNQLRVFLQKLSDAGFILRFNWKVEMDQYEFHNYRVGRGDNYTHIIFQVWNNNKGFSHYIESHEINMDRCIGELVQSLKEPELRLGE